MKGYKPFTTFYAYCSRSEGSVTLPCLSTS